MSKPSQPISSLRDIANDFDTFIIDQWGVIHDGATVFANANDCLYNLKKHNKQVILLSNSGKRVDASYERFLQMGLSSSTYDFVMTSGEHVHQCLKNRSNQFYQNLGHSFYFFSWDNDKQIIEGLDYNEVDNIQDADFILCAGVDRIEVTNYLDDLKLAQELNIPLIVANPDLVSKTPEGKLKPCPGAIAACYEKMGGYVHWHGKPQSEIYEMCNISTLASRCLAIGDSLLHDIKGGQNAKMQTLLILNGIHRQQISDSTLESLFLDKKIEPSYYMDSLKW